jgi:PIN domain nuclease of toxin-antitoxin system
LRIDTHILLWVDERPRRIALTLRTAMRDETIKIVVTAVTI